MPRKKQSSVTIAIISALMAVALAVCFGIGVQPTAVSAQGVDDDLVDVGQPNPPAGEPIDRSKLVKNIDAKEYEARKKATSDGCKTVPRPGYSHSNKCIADIKAMCSRIVQLLQGDEKLTDFETVDCHRWCGPKVTALCNQKNFKCWYFPEQSAKSPYGGCRPWPTNPPIHNNASKVNQALYQKQFGKAWAPVPW